MAVFFTASWVILFPLCLFPYPLTLRENKSLPDASVYAVEIQGRLAGYSVDRTVMDELKGEPVRVFSSRTVLTTGPKKSGSLGSLVIETRYWVHADSIKVLKASLEYLQEDKYEKREAYFEEGSVRYFVKTAIGEEENKSVLVAKDVRVPYCRAFPVLELLKSGQEELSLQVFNLKDGGQQSMKVSKRGDSLLKYHGVSYACQRFTLHSSDAYKPIELWVTKEGEVIKENRPIEGLCFRPAHPDTAEKLATQWDSRLSFVPVPEKIENRFNLTFMCLKASLWQGPIRNVAELNTESQRFEGAVEDGKIEGIFRIHSVYFEATKILPFPLIRESGVDIAYMEPEFQIESNHPDILGKAKEVTSGLKNLRHVVHALGSWIKRNVALDPTGDGGALRALSEGKTGAEGFAKLHVAMCRSLGIPSRVITGGLYVPTDTGGGFAEHFWSEVHTGQGGWMPVDAALGEFDYLDAGHVRLGSAGNFEPLCFKILDYIPKPEEARMRVPVMAADFPLPLGETHRYDYFLDDELLGTERVTFLGEKVFEGKQVFCFTTEVDFEGRKGKSFTRVQRNGRLLMYRSELDTISRDCKAEEDEILCSIKSSQGTKKEKIDVPKEGLFFDNRHVFHLGFLLSRLVIKPGDTVQVGVFNPSTLRILPLKIHHTGRCETTHKGIKLNVRVFDLWLGSQRMIVHLTDEGKVVEEFEQNGRVRVVWQGIDH